MKENFKWDAKGVEVTEVVNVANGTQVITTILNDGEELEMPEFDEKVLMHNYKDTIILALKGRMGNCVKELVAAPKKAVRGEVSWSYITDKECVNTFNYLAYKAMKQAIKLAEEEKFDEFTALMWEQVLKGLSRVKKKWDIKPYPFDTLFGYAIDQFHIKQSTLEK